VKQMTLLGSRISTGKLGTQLERCVLYRRVFNF